MSEYESVNIMTEYKKFTKKFKKYQLIINVKIINVTIISYTRGKII